MGSPGTQSRIWRTTGGSEHSRSSARAIAPPASARSTSNARLTVRMSILRVPMSAQRPASAAGGALLVMIAPAVCCMQLFDAPAAIMRNSRMARQSACPSPQRRPRGFSQGMPQCWRHPARDARWPHGEPGLQQDAPSTYVLPHADPERAVESLVGHPRANHLGRVSILKRGRWDHEFALVVHRVTPTRCVERPA